MEEYSIWLNKAQDDLKWTQHNLTGSIWYGACFTAQQAAEKALKAYLLSKRKSLRKVHDLGALLEDCTHIDTRFERLRSIIASLAAYYITTRYPVYEDLAQFSEEQARRAFTDASTVVAFVEKHIE